MKLGIFMNCSYKDNRKIISNENKKIVGKVMIEI